MIWLRFWLDIWKTRPSKLWGSALWIWSCNTNLYIIAPVHWTVFNWIITKSIYSCYNNTCVGITRVLEQSRLTNDSCLKIVRGTSVKCEMMFGNLNLHWALLSEQGLHNIKPLPGRCPLSTKHYGGFGLLLNCLQGCVSNPGMIREGSTSRWLPDN